MMEEAEQHALSGIDKYELPWTWVVAGLIDNERECWCNNWGPQDLCFRSHISRLPDGSYRVHSWGNDDIGMVIDVGTREKAFELYSLLAIHAPTDDMEHNNSARGVTSVELEALGFEWF